MHPGRNGCARLICVGSAVGQALKIFFYLQ
jgi:hypothetical protein